jgi:hypothetical protein
MSEDRWLMRVEKSLSANFKQPSGPSRPGVMWSVGLKRGDETYVVMVKGLLMDDATLETRNDQTYQAQTVMQYLNDQLNQGWHPRQEREHTIHIGNPLPSAPNASTSNAQKPWWKR